MRLYRPQWMAECRAPSSRPARRPRDPCAVETRRLAGVVRAWVDRWERDHHDLAAAARRNALDGRVAGNGAVSAITILHERIQLRGGDVPHDTIYRVLTERTRHTELVTADALVGAIERPEAFHDGTLEIIPNPNARAAERASCCGSLNGSL